MTKPVGNVSRQRVNMDLDKDLWKQVGIRAIEEGMNKKDLVEKALVNYLKEALKMEKTEIKLNWVTHDHDLKALEVIDADTGETICKVYPNTIEEMEEMKAEIEEYGTETVLDWEDGSGNIVETLVSEYEDRA